MARLRLPWQQHGATPLGRPAGSATGWRDAAWCAIDLELTGLDPSRHEIVAVGAVPVEAGRVRLGRAVYTPVRSVQPSERAALLTHKLHLDDLAHAPAPAEAMALLAHALEGRIPVFHTAAIERGFLGRALARTGRRLPDAADTEALGRLWLRAAHRDVPDRVPLARLARELELPADAPHHALGDALTTACAFISLAARLDAVRPQTVGMLLRAPEQLNGARRR